MTKDQIIRRLIEAGMDKYIASENAVFKQDGFHVHFSDLDRCRSDKIKNLATECGGLTEKGVWFRIA